MKNGNHLIFTALFLIIALLSQFIGVAAQENLEIAGGAAGDISGGSSVFVFRSSRKKAPERNAFRSVQVVHTVQARVKDRKERIEQSQYLAKVTPRPISKPTPNPKTPAEVKAVEGAKRLVFGANQYLKENNLDEAENGFYEATQLDPKNNEAKAGMATVYAVRGDAAYEKEDYSRAIAFYQKAVGFDSSNADVYASLGDALDALGQPDQAVNAYQTALSLNPKLTALNAPLGILLAATGNYLKSVDYLGKALVVSPDDVKLRDAYGLVLYKLERNDEAKKALLKAIELNPQNSESNYYLGGVYSRLNDQEQAFAAYQKAVALNPKYKEAFFDLGAAYYNRGQYAEAAQNYDKAVRLQGDYVEARLNLADAYQQMAENGEKTRYADAINQYQVVVSLLARPDNGAGKQANSFKPNIADVYSKFGYCYGRNKQWKEALDYMKKAVALQPDAVSYTNLAWAYNGNGNFADGKQAAQEALNRNPNFPAAYFNLGNAQARSGQYKEAEESFKQALKFKKEWADALNNLGFVYGKMNDWRKAADAHQAAAQAEPNSANAHFNLGYASVELGDRKTAERERDILLQLNPNQAKILDEKIRNSSFNKDKKRKDKNN